MSLPESNAALAKSAAAMEELPHDSTDDPTPPRDVSLLSTLGLTADTIGALAPERSSRAEEQNSNAARTAGDGAAARA